MKTLQDLLDRQALADLVAAYSRAVDRREFSILESLYHPDAIHDHGPMFQGKRDDFIAWIKQSPATMTTQHFVGNALHVQVVCHAGSTHFPAADLRVWILRAEVRPERPTFARSLFARSLRSLSLTQSSLQRADSPLR